MLTFAKAVYNRVSDTAVNSRIDPCGNSAPVNGFKCRFCRQSGVGLDFCSRGRARASDKGNRSRMIKNRNELMRAVAAND